MSLLIVEHNVSLALDLADLRAVLIETGRVALSGPSQAIRADDAVRRAYLSPEGSAREVWASSCIKWLPASRSAGSMRSWRWRW